MLNMICRLIVGGLGGGWRRGCGIEWWSKFVLERLCMMWRCLCLMGLLSVCKGSC